MFDKVDTELKFIERENKVRDFGKKIKFLRRVLKPERRGILMCFMMVRRLLMASRILVMFLQGYLKI